MPPAGKVRRPAAHAPRVDGLPVLDERRFVSAALRHALALVLVRQKRGTEALAMLAEAERLDPANARYAHVHAVALMDAGQDKQGMRIVEAARVRHPDDRDILSALAFYKARTGDRTGAQSLVGHLLELDPENAEYAQLARQIENPVRP